MNQTEKYPSLLKQYKPKSGEIWYHYCSAESFMNIIMNKTLRFCDLHHMNDMEELIFGERLFDKTLQATEMDDKKRLIISTVFNFFKVKIVLLSMSFSENGDQLSQWRGYADDAKGFCIGFKAKDLNKLPTNPLKVEYQLEKQTELIRYAINKINVHMTDYFSFESAVLISELLELFSIMKNYSFNEEKEYRLIYSIFTDEEIDGKLIDYNKKKQTDKDWIKDIGFRLVNNVPTPFVDIGYNTVAPIRKIVIGPKNQSSELDIKYFLSTNGINNVEIIKSSSTYR